MSILNKITGFFTAKNEDVTTEAGDTGMNEGVETPETPEIPMEDTIPVTEEETMPEAPSMTPETEEAPVVTPEPEAMPAEGAEETTEDGEAEESEEEKKEEGTEGMAM